MSHKKPGYRLVRKTILELPSMQESCLILKCPLENVFVDQFWFPANMQNFIDISDSIDCCKNSFFCRNHTSAWILVKIWYIYQEYFLHSNDASWTQTRDLAQFFCKKSIEAALKKISHLSIPPNGCPKSKCILIHTNILYNCATVFFRSMVLRVTVWLLKIPPKWLEISVKDWGKWEPKRAKLLECFFQIVLNFRYCLVVPPMLVRKQCFL